jgi:hypothetical protein
VKGVTLMSHEMIFWRQTTMMSQSSRAIYDGLNEGRPVDGLGELAIEEILTRVIDNFAGAQRKSNGSKEWVIWRSPNGEDSFEVTWSNQHVRVDSHHVQLTDMNRLVEIAALFGCPPYDPQTGERFRLPQ